MTPNSDPRRQVYGTTVSRRSLLAGAGSAAAALAFQPSRTWALTSPGERTILRGNHFRLSMDRIGINKSGTPSWANAINGGVPGPVLRWREGDVVTIKLTNNLPDVTGVHWHGIILPNPMDGVPGLEFPGIDPGETFTYKFPVVQSGTYWYHSHMGYQEQKGAYGALIIEPRGKPLIQADRDYVVVLSDWTDEEPKLIANNFKRDPEMYNFKRRLLGTFFADAQQSGLETTINERLQWADMRMDPTGIQAPTAYTYTYLVNGHSPEANWTALFRPGERIRLRFINASAVSYYDVQIPGLKMDVVHVHGNDVVPVRVDEFRIGVAETYDVIVQPKAPEAYTIFAQTTDRGGYARATLAPRHGMEAPVPAMEDRPMRTMTDMGMPGMKPDQIGASSEDHTRIGGLDGKWSRRIVGDVRKLPGHQRQVKRPPEAKSEPGIEQQFVAETLTDRLGIPGDGLNHLDRRVLTLKDLRSVRPGLDKRKPTREIVLRLTGNMHRFIWGFDGKKYTEVGPIDVLLGERFRLRMINDTMMSHPIHLHGMWMELENGHGDHRPYLHTINVKPSESVSLLVTPVATGQWPLHCHILYHFEAGMFRTLRVLPRVA